MSLVSIVGNNLLDCKLFTTLDMFSQPYKTKPTSSQKFDLFKSVRKSVPKSLNLFISQPIIVWCKGFLRGDSWRLQLTKGTLFWIELSFLLFDSFDSGLFVLFFLLSWRINIWIVAIVRSFLLWSLSLFDKKVVQFWLTMVFATFSFVQCFLTFLVSVSLPLLIMQANVHLDFNVIFVDQVKVDLLWSWRFSACLTDTFLDLTIFRTVIFFLSWHRLIVNPAFLMFVIFFCEYINLLTVRWCWMIWIQGFLIFSQVQKDWSVVIRVLCFFVIFNLWFVRIQEERLKIVILFGIVLCWVYYKLLNAIIFTQLEIPITVFLTKAVFPLKLVDMVLSKGGFFCCRRFKVTKAVSMCGLRGNIIIVHVISV